MVFFSSSFFSSSDSHYLLLRYLTLGHSALHIFVGQIPPASSKYKKVLMLSNENQISTKMQRERGQGHSSASRSCLNDVK